MKLKAVTKFILGLLMLLTVLLPQSGEAAERVIRVGWYESPFFTTGEKGRCSGYAYDYLQKVATYTGWKFEYVKGSWPQLMEMLQRGELDLMSDVSYTPYMEPAIL